LNLVSEQRLGASGAVTDRSSTIAFPVSPADRELAASGGPDRLVTVTADGDPYRVITAALPAGGAIQLGRDVRENNQLLASLRERVGLVDLLVIVLSALVGWFVASRMTRSLTVLTRATEQVAREGLLAATISTEGHDEIGRLGRSFSTMLTALTRSRRLQQQLIEDAAHELRTPLTSLRVNIDLLRRHATELQPGQREAILADLDGELAELSGLVTELVELGTDRRAEEPMRPVLVDEIARTCAERISTRLGREIVVEGLRWPVQGQHDALDRAVSNLLENAAKFSPPASRIEVAVVPGRIEVRDHGTGIDPVELTAIFDRFHRSATARGLPGSGLGLAIVKDIVSRHGGTVFAENAPDGGAVVGFTLGVSSD